MQDAKAVVRRLQRGISPLPPKVGSEDGDRMRGWRRVRYFGPNCACPICKARLARFVTSPRPHPRPDAMCPVCGSMEWYRLGWWYLSEHHPEFLHRGRRVLHVAAEPEIRRQFQRVEGLTYAALDLDLRRASLVADLLRLPFTDGAIDLVYCSHVLEHVDDDRAALREMRRVVQPGGAALLQVPITADETWGDPSITDPEERTRLFGQFDHVRRYGPDFVDIVRSCGWKVDQVRVADLPPATVRRHGLPRHEASRAAFDVFWCTPG